MINDPSSFRDRLIDSQPTNPALRAAYDKELDALLYEAPSFKNRLLAGILLLIFVVIVVLEFRVLLVHKSNWSFYVGSVTMLLACAVGSVWLVQDLRKAKVAKKSAHRMSELFYLAATILMVTTLIHGLRAASDPASTFGALFVFVFLFSCAVWGLSNRIAAAEMAAKEQMLRLECRLAELTERLKA